MFDEDLKINALDVDLIQNILEDYGGNSCDRRIITAIESVHGAFGTSKEGCIRRHLCHLMTRLTCQNEEAAGSYASSCKSFSKNKSQGRVSDTPLDFVGFCWTSITSCRTPDASPHYCLQSARLPSITLTLKTLLMLEFLQFLITSLW